MATASIKHDSFPDHNVAAVFYFLLGLLGTSAHLLENTLLRL